MAKIMAWKVANKGRGSAILLVVLPTLVVSLATLLLLNWHIPTRIQVDLTVDRVTFTLGSSGSIPILNPVKFQSASIAMFSQFKFIPEVLKVADPRTYQMSEDRFPDSAWTSLQSHQPVVLTPLEARLEPEITLETVDNSHPTAGILDLLKAAPQAEIAIGIRGAQTADLSIKLDRQQSFAALSVSGPFQLVTRYVASTGIANAPYHADELTYRSRLIAYAPNIEIVGQPSSFELNLTLSSEQSAPVFSKGGIPVTALSFTRQDEGGNQVTAIVSGGEITYPDFPKIEKVAFVPPDFLSLDCLEKFRVEEITLDSEHKGLRLRLNGLAGIVRTGSPEFPKDRRLTRFDMMSHNPRILVLVSVIGWIFPTMVGLFRLFKEVEA